MATTRFGVPKKLYDRAKRQYAQLLAAHGVVSRDVVQRLDELVSSRVGEFGYRRDRFPGSMVLAFRAEMARAGLRSRIPMEAEARRLGTAVFREHASRIPYAARLLALLHREKRVVLLTKGDPVVQKRRLRDSGLRKHFSSVHIVAEKHRDALAEALASESLTPTRTIVVGDSLRSDVVPSVHNGVRVVWIPAATWSHESHEVPDSPLVCQVPDLRSVYEAAKIAMSC